MIRTEITGLSEVVRKFDSMPQRLRQEVVVAVKRLTVKLQTKVKTEKLSGQVLGVRTGRLSRSIAEIVVDEGEKVVGIVSTPVVYGIAWETGNHPVRAAIASAKAKASPKGDADTFANGTPKKRPFLVPSLAELNSSGTITAEFDAAVKRATK
jgi:hypothetical protein